MAAKMSVLGLIMSSYPYLRSVMVRFPLESQNKVKRTNILKFGLFSEIGMFGGLFVLFLTTVIFQLKIICWKDYSTTLQLLRLGISYMIYLFKLWSKQSWNILSYFLCFESYKKKYIYIYRTPIDASAGEARPGHFLTGFWHAVWTVSAWIVYSLYSVQFVKCTVCTVHSV